MAETGVLIGLPVAWEHLEPIPGSITAECKACGGETWIAPSGQRYLRDNPTYQLFCSPCGLGVAAEYDEALFVLADGALNEMTPAEASAGLNLTMKLNRAMRRRRRRRG